MASSAVRAHDQIQLVMAKHLLIERDLGRQPIGSGRCDLADSDTGGKRGANVIRLTAYRYRSSGGKSSTRR